jgi:hypothetical protein
LVTEPGTGDVKIAKEQPYSTLCGVHSLVQVPLRSWTAVMLKGQPEHKSRSHLSSSREGLGIAQQRAPLLGQSARWV